MSPSKEVLNTLEMYCEKKVQLKLSTLLNTLIDNFNVILLVCKHESIEVKVKNGEIVNKKECRKVRYDRYYELIPADEEYIDAIIILAYTSDGGAVSNEVGYALRGVTKRFADFIDIDNDEIIMLDTM